MVYRKSLYTSSIGIAYKQYQKLDTIVSKKAIFLRQQCYNAIFMYQKATSN